MREVDLVLQHQPVCGRHANEFLTVDDLDRLAKTKERDFGAEVADAGGVDQMHERQRAAVHNRYLGTIDVDLHVGNSARHDRGQEVFDGTDRDVILAYGRRVVERSR